MPCMPKIADCGGLIIGVPNMDPNTPPLLMVKVPPSMSSTASSFLRAYKRTIIIQSHNQEMSRSVHKCGGKRTRNDQRNKLKMSQYVTWDITFSPNKLIAFSISVKFIPSTFRITGTTKPWKRSRIIKFSGLHFGDKRAIKHLYVYNIIHLSYLWRGYSHTDVNIFPIHNLFGCVINYWKQKT